MRVNAEDGTALVTPACSRHPGMYEERTALHLINAPARDKEDDNDEAGKMKIRVIILLL